MPKLSGTPSYGVICGDGGVRWPKDAWAASTVTSWTGSSYVPGKPGSQGTVIRPGMKSIPLRLTKQTRQKAGSSSFAHGSTSKAKIGVGGNDQKLLLFFPSLTQQDSQKFLSCTGVTKMTFYLSLPHSRCFSGDALCVPVCVPGAPRGLASFSASVKKWKPRQEKHRSSDED